MSRKARKKRRNVQITIATTLILLITVVVALTYLLNQATTARNEAFIETKRAEASKVLAIGRAIPNPDPSTKLAYALASLEFADSPEARRFALQALSEGPTAQIMEFGPHTATEISPDEKWIAAGRLDGGLDLLGEDASAPISLQESFKPGHYVQWKPQFSLDSKFLIWTWRGDPRHVKVWSLDEKKVVRTFQMEGLTMCMVRAGKAFLITDTTGNLDTPMNWGPSVVRVWKFDRNDPVLLGRIDLGEKNWKGFDIDKSGTSIAYINHTEVYTRTLNESGIGPERLAGRHSVEVMGVRFNSAGNELAALDSKGDLRLWSFEANTKNPILSISGTGGPIPFFDSKGNFLFAPRDRGIARWDLRAPDAESLVYRSPDPLASGVIVDQQNRWLAIDGSALEFYPLADGYPYIYRGRASNVRITADGKSLIGSNGVIDQWNIPGEKDAELRTLWSDKSRKSYGIDLDLSEKHLVVVTDDGVHLVSIPDGKDVLLQGKSPALSYITLDHNNVAISPDGKYAAAIGNGIEIWDLQSGKSKVLGQTKRKFCGSIKYSLDGTLFSGCDGAVYRWNKQDNSAQTLMRAKGKWVSSIALSKNGQYLAASFCSAKGLSDFRNAMSEVLLYDFKKNKVFPITSHGNRVFAVAFDRDSTKLVTGDLDGVVRVGNITGDVPHLLLGHEAAIGDIEVDPSGNWIASADGTKTVRLWRMPQGKPLDSLAWNELLSRLRSLTNVRAVADKTSPTGYRIKYEPFTGWRKALAFSGGL